MNQDMLGTKIHDPKCKKCNRLEKSLKKLKEMYPSYHCGPVSSFGPLKSDLLIVGLAPGLHGANATGRPFTGDYAGTLLFQTLYKYGFSNCSSSVKKNDGLELYNCRIVNAVKCVPPQNKPTLQEVKNCSDFLSTEIYSCKPKIILSLGKIAHDAVLRCLSLRISEFKFQHAKVHRLYRSAVILINSYHCSRYNTQTGRLTEQMFCAVFDEILDILGYE